VSSTSHLHRRLKSLYNFSVAPRGRSKTQTARRVALDLQSTSQLHESFYIPRAVLGDENESEIAALLDKENSKLGYNAMDIENSYQQSGDKNPLKGRIESSDSKHKSYYSISDKDKYLFLGNPIHDGNDVERDDYRRNSTKKSHDQNGPSWYDTLIVWLAWLKTIWIHFGNFVGWENLQIFGISMAIIIFMSFFVGQYM
jgi:hypothetical protein